MFVFSWVLWAQTPQSGQWGCTRSRCMVWASLCLDLMLGEKHRDSSLYLSLIERIVIITNIILLRPGCQNHH